MKSRQTICVCLLFTAYKIRNSGAAVYQILVCYFMAHEHLHPDYHFRNPQAN